MTDWDEFYKEYGKPLYRFLLSLTGNCHDAEELLQETFYQTFLHIDSFEGRCSLYTWLCQIGKNAWAKEWRRRKHFIEQDWQELHLYETEHSPEEKIILEETCAKARQAIYELKEPYREVFILHVFGELKLKEIAQVFGKKESWARVTYYRAKQKVAEEIK